MLQRRALRIKSWNKSLNDSLRQCRNAGSTRGGSWQQHRARKKEQLPPNVSTCLSIEQWRVRYSAIATEVVEKTLPIASAVGERHTIKARPRAFRVKCHTASSTAQVERA